MRLRLLFVEDESQIYELMEAALSDGGFEVLWGENGEHAAALLEKEWSNIAGLITDVRAGKGPLGWEIAHRARQLNPRLPVIYMTGDSADAWAANGVPESALLQKPFAPAQLVSAISGLLNDRSQATFS